MSTNPQDKNNGPMIDPLHPTLFHEPWWLDLASNGQYRTVEVTENGRTVGVLPFLCRKRLCITSGFLPQLTHFLGPAVDEGVGKVDTRFTRRFEITTELIYKLPPMDSLRIKCHRGLSDITPFQAEKFRSSVQYTHELLPQSDEQIWNNLHGAARTRIRSAQKQYEIVRTCDAEYFITLYRQNLDKKAMESNLDLSVCQKLIDLCLTKGRGAIFAAQDEKGIAAAIFCAWDAVSSYYLMTTRRPNSHGGVVRMLLLEAIYDAAHRGLIFDFDGLSSRGSVEFYASFGATLSPRYIVSRESNCLRLMRLLRSFWKEENYFTLF